MKKPMVVLVLVLTAHVASAAPSTEDGSSVVDKAKVYEGVGGALVAVSTASAIAATAYGPYSWLECGGIDGTCHDGGYEQARDIHIAIGIAAVAAVTAAVGIPLLVKGVRMSKDARRSMAFGVGPTMTNRAASGASASMTLRF